MVLAPHDVGVIKDFHSCVRDKQNILARQIVRIGDNLPRFAEGIGFRVESRRICGGLVIGDLQSDVPGRSFQLKRL